MSDLGRCQNYDCKEAATATHPGNGFNYCTKCMTNIDRVIEILAAIHRIHEEQKYENNETGVHE